METNRFQGNHPLVTDVTVYTYKQMEITTTILKQYLVDLAYESTGNLPFSPESFLLTNLLNSCEFIWQNAQKKVRRMNRPSNTFQPTKAPEKETGLKLSYYIIDALC